MLLYELTREQLAKAIADAIDVYSHYTDVHHLNRARSAMVAIDQVLLSLDVEEGHQNLSNLKFFNDLAI